MMTPGKEVIMKGVDSGEKARSMMNPSHYPSILRKAFRKADDLNV